MSKPEATWYVFNLSVSFGVFWAVYAKAGFWTALLYGVFWEIWLSYRLGEWIVLHFWR
jgi:hypothetical protein